MRCDGCGHEQEGGRFCGRCGAVVADLPRDRPPPRPTGGAAAEHPAPPVRAHTRDGGARAGPAGGGAPHVSDAAGQHGSRAPVWIIAVLGAAVLVALGVPLLGDRATSPPPVTDDRLFDDATDAVLILSDLEHTVWMLDLDTGAVEQLGAPIDGPFPVGHLFRVGEHVAMAAAEEAWLWRPGSDEARSFGEGSPVPDVEPDRMWVTDHRGGGVLLDEDGATVHETSALEGRSAFRGVPGGLAHATDTGVAVYRTESGDVHPFHDGAAQVLGSSPDRVVWCRPACERIEVSDGAGDVVGVLGLDGAEYETAQSWLSDDGRYLASSAQVTSDDGAVDFELHVFDVDDGSLVDRTRITLGRLSGDWADDGRQFLFRQLITGPSGTLQRYVVDEGFSEARVDVDDELPRGDFVTLPRSAVDWSGLDRRE